MQESTIILTDCICADGLGSSTGPGTRPFGVTDPGARSFFDPGLLAGVVVVVVLLLAAACIVVPIIYIWWR